MYQHMPISPASSSLGPHCAAASHTTVLPGNHNGWNRSHTEHQLRRAVRPHHPLESHNHRVGPKSSPQSEPAPVHSGQLSCISEGPPPPDANLPSPPAPTRPRQVRTHLQLLLGVSPQEVTDIFVVDLQVGGPDQELGVLRTLQGGGRELRRTPEPLLPPWPCPLSPAARHRQGGAGGGQSGFTGASFSYCCCPMLSLQASMDKRWARPPIVQVEKLRPQVRPGPRTGPGPIPGSPLTG